MKTKVIELGKNGNLEMIFIPKGRFLMGSPLGEPGRFDNEGPQHPVTIAPFWMGKYPITQIQYQAIMGNNPSSFRDDNRPVETVSWDEALEFCARLSAHTKQAYTLPSEAEWEYACRAGTTTPFHFGETITPHLANYQGNETTKVGIFPHNNFGLYDMHGNVFEWCLDHFHDSYSKTAILRGGSWDFNSRFCRSAYRGTGYTYCCDEDVGFRVVCHA